MNIRFELYPFIISDGGQPPSGLLDLPDDPQYQLFIPPLEHLTETVQVVAIDPDYLLRFNLGAQGVFAYNGNLDIWMRLLDKFKDVAERHRQERQESEFWELLGAHLVPEPAIYGQRAFLECGGYVPPQEEPAEEELFEGDQDEFQGGEFQGDVRNDGRWDPNRF